MCSRSAKQEGQAKSKSVGGFSTKIHATPWESLAIANRRAKGGCNPSHSLEGFDFAGVMAGGYDADVLISLHKMMRSYSRKRIELSRETLIGIRIKIAI
jgi:hypothetical protein